MDRDFDRERAFIRALEEFDTPTVTNAVATYGNKPDTCLGLYHPWEGKWYTNQSLKCMFPQLGPRCGYAVTCSYSLPDPAHSRYSMTDILLAMEESPKPVVLVVKQEFPEDIKQRNGLIGGNMMTCFTQMGAVGVISDGPSRDVNEIRDMNVQYMLTGLTPGHGDFAVRSVGLPAEVCGMLVAPGDIIHMDEHGAVKFPAKHLERVLANCRAIIADETEKQQRMRSAPDAKELGAIYSGKA